MTNINDLISSSPSSPTSTSSSTSSSLSQISKTSSTTATATKQPEKSIPKDPTPLQPQQQQRYKPTAATDVEVPPVVRRKRMPAGRHSVVVSPPAKAENQMHGQGASPPGGVAVGKQ